MHHIRTLPACIILTILLSIPMILKIPGLLPFLQSDVRAAAPQTIEMLRAQGIWVVNAKLVKMEERENEICFDWIHRYRSRVKIDPPELLSTCIQ